MVSKKLCSGPNVIVLLPRVPCPHRKGRDARSRVRYTQYERTRGLPAGPSARLLLRSGTAYVSALDCKDDLIVVDGKLRTDCVERVLGSQLLKPGGMLVLMDVWRPEYQPTVRRMIDLGGELIDGDGLQTWLVRSPLSFTYDYPREACVPVL